MDIGIFYDNVTLSSRIDYVIDFLNNHKLLSQGARFLINPKKCNIKIAYSSEIKTGEIHIPKQSKLFSEKEPQSNIYKSNQYSFDALVLYGLEIESKNIQPFFADNKFGFDLFETIFFHISRYEEYHCKNEMRNKWDVMHAEEMFLVKNKIEKIPVVDHIVYSFFKCLGLKPKLRKTNIVISHDIDHIRKFNNKYSFTKKLFGHLRRGEISLIGEWRKQAKKYKKDKIDPYDVYDWLLIKGDGSNHERNKMIFYLMGGSSVYDTPIPPDDPIFLESILKAKERGYEIGTHPSYEAWNDQGMARNEKESLEEIIGNDIKISRQHYLHFKFSETIRILESNGIELDSSLGFFDRIGFRCGTGFIYKLYDLEEERISSVKELPLVFMDSAIIREAKRDGSEHEMIRICNTFLEKNKYFTCITCNFHNSRFEESEMRGWPLKTVFEKFKKLI